MNKHSIDKDASRVEALQRWPDRSDDFRLKKHVGRSDAALIAEWFYSD